MFYHRILPCLIISVSYNLMNFFFFFVFDLLYVALKSSVKLKERNKLIIMVSTDQTRKSSYLLKVLTCIMLELAIAVINQISHFFLNLPLSNWCMLLIDPK